MRNIFIFLLLFVGYNTVSSQNLWLGSYTNNSDYGIRLLSFQQDGSLSVLDSVAVPQASFLVQSKKGILYAVEENLNGNVHAIRSNSEKRFEVFSSQPSMGAHPCYISLDKSEQWLTVGNYSSGNLSLYRIQDDGSISAPITVIQHKGKSTNKERQEAAHVHSTVFTPDNKFLLVPDLGIDSVMVYAFNEITGQLSPTQKSIGFETGGGPRHLSFDPTGKYLYILGELNGWVEIYDYKNQEFVFKDKATALPPDFKGSFTAADIHITKDGKHLYLTLRDKLNQIVVFNIQEDGRLKYKNRYSTGGVNPRNFFISEDDQWVLVENQNSNNIIVFKRDKNTGELEYSNHLENVPQPVCLINK